MTTDIYSNINRLKQTIIVTIGTLDKNFIDSTPEVHYTSDELAFFTKTLLPGAFESIANKMDIYLPHADALDRYVAQCESQVVMVSHYNELDADKYNERIDTCVNIANNLKKDFDKISSGKK